MKPPFWVAVAALAALALAMSLSKANDNTLRGIDSNIHAYVSMRVTDQGLLPDLPMAAPPVDGRAGEIFNDHPFTLFWLNGWVMRALGPSSFSARLLTGLFAAGCTLLTLALGAELRSTALGFVAALLYQLSRGVILTGGSYSLDPPMLFFILLSFLFWRKGRWVAMGVAAGVGLWMKTPVALLAFPSALAVAALDRTLRRDGRKLALAAAIALGVGALVWLATGALGGWPLVRDYWVRQVWGTAVEGRAQPSSNPLFAWSAVRASLMPWWPLLFYALYRIARLKRWREPEVRVPVAAALIMIAAISLMRFKYDYYLNPAFPFLAILGAIPIAGWLERKRAREERFYFGFSAAVPVALAVLVAAPIVVGPEAFPSLRRFAPYIASAGKCADAIVLEGGEGRYGGPLDRKLMLAFYTGHPVRVTGCQGLSAEAGKPDTHWLVLDAQDGRCLGARGAARFTWQLKSGGRLLLSDRLPGAAALDLTPLDREGRAATACLSAREP